MQINMMERHTPAKAKYGSNPKNTIAKTGTRIMII